MKLVLTLAAATGLMAASALSAMACPMHSAGHDNKMTVAEAPLENSEEAASTFDPAKLKLAEEEKSE